MGRRHPFRQALWLAWFGLALCGGFLVWDLIVGNWLGVGAMVVMWGLLGWLLHNIRQRRLELEAERERLRG